MSGWSRNEIISAAVLLVGILSAVGTWLAVPGVRSGVLGWLGSEDGRVANPSPAADSPAAATRDRRETAVEHGPGEDADEPPPLRVPGGSDPAPADEPGDLASAGGRGGEKTRSPTAEDGPGTDQSADATRSSSGAPTSDSTPPLTLTAEDGTTLSFGEARCRRDDAIVRCDLAVSNPTATDVSLALVRSGSSAGGSGTRLELPDGGVRPAAAIRFGGYVARGLTQLTDDELAPGDSSRAALAFEDVPDAWRGADLRLVVRTDGEPATVWFRSTP